MIDETVGSNDRPWVVDFLLHRLCLRLSRLLWHNPRQRPDDHSGWLLCNIHIALQIKLKGNQSMVFSAISLHIVNPQGVIMNDEGDAVEFSPRNSRKVWSTDKKEVADFLVMRCWNKMIQNEDNDAVCHIWFRLETSGINWRNHAPKLSFWKESFV